MILVIVNELMECSDEDEAALAQRAPRRASVCRRQDFFSNALQVVELRQNFILEVAILRAA